MNLIINKYSLVFIGLLMVYVILALMLPTNPEVLSRYDITELTAKVLSLTIIIPVLAIYLTALYGFLRFKEYSVSIKSTTEGEYYGKISKGLMFIAFSLPILAILNTISSYTKFSATEIYPTMNLVQLYAALTLFAIGVSFFSAGAKDLFNSLNKKGQTKSSIGGYLFCILVVFIFSWLIALPTGDTNQENVGIQALPIWVAILTVVIPYVYIWFLGVRATMHLYKYKTYVKGVIFKRAFSNIYKGFGIIIAISVMTQLISSLSAQLNRLDLSPLLLIIYLLVAVYAVGYILVAKGSRQLRKIEEA